MKLEDWTPKWRPCPAFCQIKFLHAKDFEVEWVRNLNLDNWRWWNVDARLGLELSTSSYQCGIYIGGPLSLSREVYSAFKYPEYNENGKSFRSMKISFPADVEKRESDSCSIPSDIEHRKPMD